MVRDPRSTGIDSNVHCSFYGPGVKKIIKNCPGVLKTHITTWKLCCGFLVFCSLLLTDTFYMQCIYKLLTMLRDMLMKSRFE